MASVLRHDPISDDRAPPLHSSLQATAAMPVPSPPSSMPSASGPGVTFHSPSYGAHQTTTALPASPSSLSPSSLSPTSTLPPSPRSASIPPASRSASVERRSSAVRFGEDVVAPTEGTPAPASGKGKGKAASGGGGSGSNRSASRSRAAAAPPTASKAAGSMLPDARQGDGELTAVDMKWGTLFGIDGQPTKRFKEVMHSLAQFMIDQFIPTGSLVIVPEKLAALYAFHRIENDPFHYAYLFKAHTRDLNRRMAELFQDMGCSYHLVQADPASRPRIPGLTPDGFVRWMVLHLQAFPDEEARRLQKMLCDYPLETKSALDGRSERLPKQLSRYLLPRVPDHATRSLLQQAVRRHFGAPHDDTGRPRPPPLAMPSPAGSGVGAGAREQRTPSLVSTSPHLQHLHLHRSETAPTSSAPVPSSSLAAAGGAGHRRSASSYYPDPRSSRRDIPPPSDRSRSRSRSYSGRMRSQSRPPSRTRTRSRPRRQSRSRSRSQSRSRSRSRSRTRSRRRHTEPRVYFRTESRRDSHAKDYQAKKHRTSEPRYHEGGRASRSSLSGRGGRSESNASRVRSTSRPPPPPPSSPLPPSPLSPMRTRDRTGSLGAASVEGGGTGWSPTRSRYPPTASSPSLLHGDTVREAAAAAAAAVSPTATTAPIAMPIRGGSSARRAMSPKARSGVHASQAEIDHPHHRHSSSSTSSLERRRHSSQHRGGGDEDEGVFRGVDPPDVATGPADAGASRRRRMSSYSYNFTAGGGDAAAAALPAARRSSLSLPTGSSWAPGKAVPRTVPSSGKGDPYAARAAGEGDGSDSGSDQTWEDYLRARG